MTDVEVVEAIYAAMAERDFDRLFELVDDTAAMLEALATGESGD